MLLKKLDEAKYICIGVVWRIGRVIWRSGRSLADFGSVWQNVAELGLKSRFGGMPWL